MSAIALMYQRNSERASEPEFERFSPRVAQAKRLTNAPAAASGWGALAHKFDTAASLHRGVATDAATGSWLIAAGTVVDPAHSAPDGDLTALLRDYVAHGATVFERLDGLFALAIYNGRTRTLAIVSDPFAFFSVFYGERGDCAFIANSALAVAQQIQAAPSELGVQTFLRTGKVFGETTLWREVKRLRPATVLEFGADSVRESTYWSRAVDRSLSSLSLSDAVDATANVLPALLKRNLAREGKVWSDLTGGFDTRFMVALLERANIPFKANFVGSDDHPDVQIAKTIVKQTGWEHAHFELPRSWAQDAPQYLEEALYRGDGHLNVLLLLRPLWVHHRECEQFTTLLSGLGGEIWRGIYWWSERAAIGRTTDAHYERQLWSLMHPIPEEVLRANSKPWAQDELARQFRQVGERVPDAPNTFKLDSVWAFRETGHVGAWTSFAGGLLRYLPPLFSKDIFTFVTSLDYRWRVNNSLVKHVLDKYRPVLSNIEVEGRGPAAPLRLDNWYRFIPSRLAYARKAADKFSQIAFGKTLWQATRPVSYSRLEWRQEIVRHAAARGLFDPAAMHSGNLYRPERLASFLSDAQTETFKHEEFLGRVLTVEMALRETGASVE
ncbi:MAG: hypothetical protein HY782_12105 [Chloroflexi bacterium]|nr:hypothetical protein [Chloroflexota bacterium]